MSLDAEPVPYLPIDRHAVIGDRLTAALVAADGTIDWLCLPEYGDEPVLGSLLDARSGGYVRFGPLERCLGAQAYLDGTAVVETTYTDGAGHTLVAKDAMLLAPHSVAADEAQPRAVLRHLASRDATVQCALTVRPRCAALRVWCSAGTPGLDSLRFTLGPGDEAWAVLSFGETSAWTESRANASLNETIARWRAFAGRIDQRGKRGGRVLRSLLTIHLLGNASTGSVVAAATTSLPERIGGDLNYDYRLSWVRDSSLAVTALATHGDLDSARHYLDWLVQLESSAEAPLQAAYTPSGGRRPIEGVSSAFCGYRGSRPVRTGNRAWRQKQLGIMGFVADCIATYLDEGGPWLEDYFRLLARVADYAAAHWNEPDNGIWELPKKRRHIASLVMSWVALDRAVAVAERLGHGDTAEPWRAPRDAIRADTLQHGYSNELRAFRHAVGIDALDASTLLIPIVGFLPAEDARVVSTVDRIAEQLTIDGHVHRFVPSEVLGSTALPLGEHEPSFLLCTCWLATAYALGGRLREAEAALARVERCAGGLGLFSEGVDARSGALRGNYPLLFTHAEYVRAANAIEQGRAPRRTPRNAR